MDNVFDNLPSLGQMFKLVIILVLALVALGIVMAILKMLLPLFVVALLVAGGIYLYNKLQADGAAA